MVRSLFHCAFSVLLLTFCHWVSDMSRVQITSSCDILGWALLQCSSSWGSWLSAVSLWKKLRVIWCFRMCCGIQQIFDPFCYLWLQVVRSARCPGATQDHQSQYLQTQPLFNWCWTQCETSVERTKSINKQSICLQKCLIRLKWSVVADEQGYKAAQSAGVTHQDEVKMGTV